MLVEFKKSSLPKVQSIPPRFFVGQQGSTMKKIMKLGLENEDLREEIFSLRRKLEKKNATTPTAPPPRT